MKSLKNAIIAGSLLLSTIAGGSLYALSATGENDKTKVVRQTKTVTKVKNVDSRNACEIYNSQNEGDWKCVKLTKSQIKDSGIEKVLGKCPGSAYNVCVEENSYKTATNPNKACEAYDQATEGSWNCVLLNKQQYDNKNIAKVAGKCPGSKYNACVEQGSYAEYKDMSALESAIHNSVKPVVIKQEVESKVNSNKIKVNADEIQGNKESILLNSMRIDNLEDKAGDFNFSVNLNAIYNIAKNFGAEAEVEARYQLFNNFALGAYANAGYNVDSNKTVKTDDLGSGIIAKIVDKNEMARYAGVGGLLKLDLGSYKAFDFDLQSKVGVAWMNDFASKFINIYGDKKTISDRKDKTAMEFGVEGKANYDSFNLKAGIRYNTENGATVIIGTGYDF